jgi:hypothetical protein
MVQADHGGVVIQLQSMDGIGPCFWYTLGGKWDDDFSGEELKRKLVEDNSNVLCK